MKRLFLILGGVIMLGVASLSLVGVYLIEAHQKKLNRMRTEKARETRLKNLGEKKPGPKPEPEPEQEPDYEQEPFIYQDNGEEQEKQQEETTPGPQP